MATLDTPSRLPVDASKRVILESRIVLRDMKGLEGQCDDESDILAPPSRIPTHGEGILGLDGQNTTTTTAGFSGRKRSRKQEHPQRVADFTESRDELPAAIPDDMSRGSSRHTFDGDDTSRKRFRRLSENTNSPKLVDGNRVTGKSPPAVLAAAAQAATQAALASCQVTRTIGFDTSPSVVAKQLPFTNMPETSNPTTTTTAAATVANAPVAGDSKTTKSSSLSTAPANPVPQQPQEKDKSKPITSFFHPTNPTRSASLQGNVVIVDGEHNSLDAELPPGRTSKGSTAFPIHAQRKSPESVVEDGTRMRNQLEQAQVTIKQLTAALTKAHTDADAMRAKVASLKADQEATKLHTDKLTAQFAEERSAAAQNLVPILRESCLKESANFRRRVAEGQARLGHITAHRSGPAVMEVWEDGDEFTALLAQEASLKAQKADLEKEKKEITRRHKKLRGPTEKSGKKKAGDESDDSDNEVSASVDDFLTDLNAANAALSKSFGGTALIPSSTAPSASGALESIAEAELVAREESIVSALAAIKREEAALAEKRKALEAEKAVLLLDIKILKAENASRWKNNPVLGDPPRYMLLQLLGKGGFSEVWRAMDLYDVKEVAAKIHQLAPQWSEEKKRNYVKHALREYDIQKSLCHPNVVRLHAVIEIDADSFATVLEHCKGGDLEKLLKSQSTLPEREARAIILQVMSALRYFNGYTSPWLPNTPPMGPPPPKRKIIHYDLKPANILFDEGRNVKVTDFGLSKIIDEDAMGGAATSLELTSQGAGTYWYLPPECFHADVRISSKVDVWSVGVIFYQMLYGKRPFGDGQTQEQFAKETNLKEALRSLTFPGKPTVSKEAKNFISRCLTYDVVSRPDVMAISEDAYLTKMKI